MLFEAERVPVPCLGARVLILLVVLNTARGVRAFVYLFYGL